MRACWAYAMCGSVGASATFCSDELEHVVDVNDGLEPLRRWECSDSAAVRTVGCRLKARAAMSAS